jgi:hypothetical protein
LWNAPSAAVRKASNSSAVTGRRSMGGSVPS